MLQCKTKWKKSILSNLSTLEKGVQVNGDLLSEKGLFPVINGGIEPSGYYDKYNREPNTITISEGGNSCGFVNYMNVPFWSGGHCYTLANVKDIDVKYLYHFLKFQEHNIMKLRLGSGLPNIQRKDIENFKIVFFEENNNQQKIADILSTCDEVIEKTEETIEKYKQIKAGMMQDLFTRGLDENGKLRPTYAQAPDLYKYSIELDRYIPKKWDAYPVSKYIDSLEAGVSVNSNDISSMSEVAVLKTSCVSDGKFFPNENKTVIEKDLNRVKINPKKDSLIISRMNTPLLVGEMGYVEHDYSLLFLPDRLWQTVKSNINSINMRFLNYLLNTEKYKKAIKEKATGTSNSMKNITKEDFLNTLLPIPKEEEQDIISKYLLQMDLKIKVEEQYLNKYKQIKQGLMKRLLTPPADAEIVEE